MDKTHSLKTFIECSPDAAVIINGEGEIVLMNGQAEDLFGYQRNEVAGRKVEVLIPDKYFNSHIRDREKFLSEPRSRPMGHPGSNLVGKKKNGKEFNAEISLSPIRTSSDELFIFAAIRDVTGRIDTEKKLREAQGMFERIFQSSLNGILKCSAVFDSSRQITDFRFVLVNQRALELMRRSKEEVLGKTLLEVNPALKDSGLFQMMVRATEKRDSGVLEFPLEREAGTVWYKASFVQMDDGVLLTFDDITFRKDTEKKLKELNIDLESRVYDRTEKLSDANERLKNINDKLDKYAYMISHDLKAPLGNVEGIVELIKLDYRGKPFDEEGDALLDTLKTQVQEMRAIIEDVLKSAKDEIRNKELVNVRFIVHEVIETLKPSKRFHIFVQSNLPRVKYNRTSLKQIFQNLLGNAIKYMDKEQPLITISCNETDDYYLICVSDNGPGIPKEKQKDIFELFETANADSCKIDSHGIGLTIVKQLVEENGGRIWVESELGEETKFHFTIPKNG